MAKQYVCETQHANRKKSNTFVHKQRSDSQNDHLYHLAKVAWDKQGISGQKPLLFYEMCNFIPDNWSNNVFSVWVIKLTSQINDLTQELNNMCLRKYG